MSNQNNVPSVPGFYYYRGGDIVCVYGEPGDLWVMMFGTTDTYPIEEMNSALWGGPVLMPGEWAPRELYESTLERLWVAENGVDPSTGDAWLTPRMERDANRWEATQ